MTTLWQSIELQRIGWALLHSLWQGAAICALAAAILRLTRHKSPQFRYFVACCALGGLVVAAVGTWLYLLGGPSFPYAEAAAAPIALTKSAGVGAWAWLAGIVPTLPIIWAAGVFVFSVRLLGGWFWFRRGLGQGASPAPQEWRWRAASLSRMLGIPKRVRVLVSPKLCSPMAVGWIKPMVLLPASAILHLRPEALEAILAHELAHIRRRDFLVNLVQSIVEALFFYHPAVWWLSGQMRELREHCCDDLAVKICGSPASYAAALTELETLRGHIATPQLAHAANGASLMKRIQRLLGILEPVSLGIRTSLIAASILSMVGAGALWGFSLEAQQRLERQRIIIRDGNKSLNVNMLGDVKLDPSSKDGVALGEGAALEISEKENGATRRLSLRLESDGLKKTYTVNGQEKPLDADGEAWLKNQIGEIHAVEIRRVNLIAPNQGGAIRFEISEDGKTGKDSKTIIYSNSAYPLLWNGAPIAAKDFHNGSFEVRLGKNPGELKELAIALKKRAEGFKQEEFSKEKLDKYLKDSRKQLEEHRWLYKEKDKLKLPKEAIEEILKQSEELFKQSEDAAKQSEEISKQLEDSLRQLRQYPIPSQEKIREKLKDLKVPSFEMDIFLPFPSEFQFGQPSLNKEAQKRRIEEEMKALKARLEKLEEQLKQAEAK
jgi:beta-lactamase regulating signal transducer with metallopeptidase domain